jgi:uncharacterized membrane-anchored protein
MKPKNIIIIAFVIVAIIQLAVPTKMIYNYEHILSKGKHYKFQIAPIDPSDPFRGKYINIRIKESWFKADKINIWKYNEVIYVLLDSNNTNGFVWIKSITKVKPESNIDFIKAKVTYSNDGSVSIDYPFKRYYLEESIAPKVEKLYSDALRDTNKLSFLIVNAIDGNAVVNDLIINGKSIKEIK